MEIGKQTVLISGGAGAIGSALCEFFQDKALQVILIDKDSEKLQALKSRFPPISIYTCDLTNGQSVKQVAKDISEIHKVSILINNAGYIYSEPLLNIMSKEDGFHNFENWDNTIQSNLYSAFYLTSCIAKSMTSSRTKGLILNISSIAAQGNVGQSAYSAAKAGIEALTKTWSKELGMFRIRCACIAPGFFNTSSTQENVNIHMLEKWKKSIPLAKLGELNELLSATQFIIENDYFNGKILSLDGGLTI